MKKMHTRFLSLALALILVISVLPAALATGNETPMESMKVLTGDEVVATEPVLPEILTTAEQALHDAVCGASGCPGGHLLAVATEEAPLTAGELKWLQELNLAEVEAQVFSINGMDGEEEKTFYMALRYPCAASPANRNMAIKNIFAAAAANLGGVGTDSVITITLLHDMSLTQASSALNGAINVSNMTNAEKLVFDLNGKNLSVAASGTNGRFLFYIIDSKDLTIQNGSVTYNGASSTSGMVQLGTTSASGEFSPEVTFKNMEIEVLGGQHLLVNRHAGTTVTFENSVVTNATEGAYIVYFLTSNNADTFTTTVNVKNSSLTVKGVSATMSIGAAGYTNTTNCYKGAKFTSTGGNPVAVGSSYTSTSTNSNVAAGGAVVLGRLTNEDGSKTLRYGTHIATVGSVKYGDDEAVMAIEAAYNGAVALTVVGTFPATEYTLEDGTSLTVTVAGGDFGAVTIKDENGSAITPVDGVYTNAAAEAVVMLDSAFTRTLTLSNDLSVNFYVDPTSLAEATMEFYTLRMTKDVDGDGVDADDPYVEVNGDDWTIAESNGKYKFTFAGFGAAEMETVVYIDVTFNNGSGDQAAMAQKNTSIKAYAESRLAKDITTEESALMNALLAYGTAAKAYNESLV